MGKLLKYIKGKLNIPLIIFLLLVGSLLIISNSKNNSIKQAKKTVNTTVNDISKNLNNAASGKDTQ